MHNEEGNTRHKLNTVTIYSADICGKRAVVHLGEDVLMIRLSDCTDPRDFHAKGITDHKACWNKHVVGIKYLAAQTNMK